VLIFLKKIATSSEYKKLSHYWIKNCCSVETAASAGSWVSGRTLCVHDSRTDMVSVSLWVQLEAVSVLVCLSVCNDVLWSLMPDKLANSDSFDGFKLFLKAILFSRYDTIG